MVKVQMIKQLSEMVVLRLDDGSDRVLDQAVTRNILNEEVLYEYDTDAMHGAVEDDPQGVGQWVKAQRELDN